MKSIIIVYIIILLLGFLNTLFPLDPSKNFSQYIHQIYQTEDGLPQNTVQCILQTHDKYIWLGTQEGLVRFDGLNFKTYNKQNTPELKQNNIVSLYEDNENTLWVGTYGNGITLFKDRKFYNFSSDEKIKTAIISCILMDNKGMIWIGTLGRGIINYRNGEFSYFTTDNGLSNDIISSIVQSHDQNIWIGTRGGGINKFRDGKFIQYSTKDGLSNDVVLSIYEDSYNNLWIGTKGGGLNRLILKEERTPIFTVYTTKDGLSNNSIISMYEDKDRTLFIGTDGGGLNRIRDGVITNLSSKKYISNNIVRSIYEDEENDLWVGTDGGGLNKYRDGKFTHITTEEGLSNDMVVSIFEDSLQNLWIATDESGLNIYKNNVIKKITTRDGLSSDMRISIYEDSYANMWFASSGGGLNKYDGKNITSYTTKDGLGSNIIKVVYEDSNNNLWIGTNGGGLNKLSLIKKTKTGQLFESYTTKNGLNNNMVLSIYEDRKQNIWIGTRGGGLHKFKDGQFSVYTTSNGLNNDVIVSIYEDNESNLWIGTNGGGLNRLKDGKFSSFTSKDGLFNDVIFCILEDNDNNLWMTCNQGIFKVNKDILQKYENKQIDRIKNTVYGLADGMLSQECNGGNVPSGWMSIEENKGNIRNYAGKTGRVKRLYFPTVRGVSYIEPDNIRMNKISPSVHIEYVKVNDETIDIDNQSKDDSGKYQFKNDQNNFVFKYTACSFVYPKSMKFKYMLEGYDKDWIETEYDMRLIRYTNLSSGEYNFKVKACNNDGIWTDKDITLSFLILKPFYMELWFLLLSILSILFFGSVLNYFIIQKFQKIKTARREAQIATKIVNKFMSPVVAKMFLENPEKLELGGEKKLVTIFFSDINSFTTISENLDNPEKVLQMLNEYLTIFSNPILESGGVVDKYIGDAIMAFWGAPLEIKDHAEQACLAALKSRELLLENQEKFKKDYSIDLAFRIGIHTGHASVGNAGSNERFDYTIIGDSVNIASRLEVANKYYGTNILISEDTEQYISKDFFRRPVDKLIVKGKSKPTLVFELFNQKEDPFIEYIPDFNAAMNEYYSMNFKKALELFKKIRITDLLTQIYINRCASYIKEPPLKNWNGVFEIKH